MQRFVAIYRSNAISCLIRKKKIVLQNVSNHDRTLWCTARLRPISLCHVAEPTAATHLFSAWKVLAAGVRIAKENPFQTQPLETANQSAWRRARPTFDGHRFVTLIDKNVAARVPIRFNLIQIWSKCSKASTVATIMPLMEVLLPQSTTKLYWTGSSRYSIVMEIKCSTKLSIGNWNDWSRR